MSQLDINREIERKGQAIADAMGRYRGTEPLIEAVRRMSTQLYNAEQRILDISTERDTLYEAIKEALSDARILLSLNESQRDGFISAHLIEPLAVAVSEFQKSRVAATEG